MCTKLSKQDAKELRANINRVLRGSHPNKSFICKAEARALKELKGDKDRLVLTADKGVAMVVMDRQDYINKSSNLFIQPAYRPIPRDPTNKIKAKLITILKSLKIKQGWIVTHIKPCTPQAVVPPNPMSSSRS